MILGATRFRTYFKVPGQYYVTIIRYLGRLDVWIIPLAMAVRALCYLAADDAGTKDDEIMKILI